MVPARPLVLLATVPVVLALLSLADRTVLLPMLGMDGLIFLVAGIDALLARRGLVTVRRSCRRVFSVGQPNLIELDVRSRARRKPSYEAWLAAGSSWIKRYTRSIGSSRTWSERSRRPYYLLSE